MICDLMDAMQPRAARTSRRDLMTFVKDRPGHDLRYAIDGSKLKRELGRVPRESLDIRHLIRISVCATPKTTLSFP
jgi:dTDP-glucose 4,6-dehydratase